MRDPIPSCFLMLLFAPSLLSYAPHQPFPPISSLHPVIRPYKFPQIGTIQDGQFGVEALWCRVIDSYFISSFSKNSAVSPWSMASILQHVSRSRYLSTFCMSFSNLLDCVYGQKRNRTSLRITSPTFRQHLVTRSHNIDFILSSQFDRCWVVNVQKPQKRQDCFPTALSKPVELKTSRNMVDV